MQANVRPADYFAESARLGSSNPKPDPPPPPRATITLTDEQLQTIREMCPRHLPAQFAVIGQVFIPPHYKEGTAEFAFLTHEQFEPIQKRVHALCGTIRP
jgi:hypothetical protein